jgi:DNA-directed RNA polymerase specialized sigma24 family protein
VIVDDVELRELAPKVLSVLVRRGADFATAEDAVQEALIRALSAGRATHLRIPRAG